MRDGSPPQVRQGELAPGRVYPPKDPWREPAKHYLADLAFNVLFANAPLTFKLHQRVIAGPLIRMLDTEELPSETGAVLPSMDRGNLPDPAAAFYATVSRMVEYLTKGAGYVTEVPARFFQIPREPRYPVIYLAGGDTRTRAHPMNYAQHCLAVEIPPRHLYVSPYVYTYGIGWCRRAV